MFRDDAAVIDTPRAMRATCLAERHVAARSSMSTDAVGITHARCRHCGCELRRLPTLRRWFRSGLMGAAAT